MTVLRVVSAEEPFRSAFASIRTEFNVPASFPDDVLAEANAVAATSGASMPARRDARDIPFVTIDPAGSKDLDQAFHAESTTDGFRVYYAIADVGAFVSPGGALDRECMRRAVTLYFPDGRTPMLPEVLCEGAASLLPNEDRPAVLWTIDLDRTGVATHTHVERATVNNRRALSFDDVQNAVAGGTAEPALTLLREIGELRLQREAARGGISLDLPTQEVEPVDGGGYSLVYRPVIPVESWNAQISLLTGMEAAKLMVAAHQGLLRTLPPPDPGQIDRLRRIAKALGVSWPDGAEWGTVVRGLDRGKSGDAAFLLQAAHVLRGAGYTVLDETNSGDPATAPMHAGVAAPYAHVTAPMRRLGDRFANEFALSICAGIDIPEWAVAGLHAVADAMQAATHRSAQIDHAVIDAVECVLLQAHVGEERDGVVIDKNAHGAIVQIADPAVVAPMLGEATLGSSIRVRIASVDVVTRRVELVHAATASR